MIYYCTWYGIKTLHYTEKPFEQVWQEPYLGNTRTIDLHIQRLKKKLDLGDAIETIYKVGYKFRAEKLK